MNKKATYKRKTVNKKRIKNFVKNYFKTENEQRKSNLIEGILSH